MVATRQLVIPNPHLLVRAPEFAIRAPKSAARGLALPRLLGVVIAVLVLLAAAAPAEAHGGGPESIISFSGLVNWLHLVGTVAWLGGIIFLRFVLGPALGVLSGADRGTFMQAALRRYTHLAWWGIATLFFSGLLTTWAHVPDPQAFTGTSYGLLLSGKILLAVGMVLCTLVITLAAHSSPISSTAPSRVSRLRQWSHLATRVNLVLTILMLLTIAGLVEFERTPVNIALNLIYYTGLIVWLGGLTFIPLVFGPSLQSLDAEARSSLATQVLARYHRLAWPTAIVTIVAAAVIAARGIDALDDLWTSGFGIVSALQVISLVAVLIIMAVARFNPQDVIGRTFSSSLAAFTPTLLIGALALFFFALGGAFYVPASASVVAEIPLAAKEGAGPPLTMLEGLGYVIAFFVTVAIIWHFAVVEQRAMTDAGESRPPALQEGEH